MIDQMSKESKKHCSHEIADHLDKNTNVRYYMDMSKGEDTRTAILEQAVQLASVQGLHGLTIGGLAQHTHLSKGGICAHFPSKQALQLAAIDHAATIFQRAVIQPAMESPSGLLRLQHLGEAWLTYIQQPVFLGGCFFTNAVFEVDDLDDQGVREAAVHQYQRFLAFVRAEVDEAIRQGQFQALMERDQFVFEFVGALIGVLVWRGLGQQSQGIALARRVLSEVLSHAQA